MSKGILLGDVFPNLSVNVMVDGKTEPQKIQLHEYFGDSWGILFSHPADYTPVCTTELSRVIKLAPEFKKRNVKLIALSCDSVKDHAGWAKDITQYCGESSLPYPIIADEDRSIARQFGMIDPDEKTKQGMPLTCRAVFIIGPDKKLKLSILYPATTGRNFAEILRVIDSLQLTVDHKVATPVDWQSGDKCMVVPSLTNEQAKEKFGTFDTKELPSGKGYMRFTDDPSKTSKK